MGVAPAVPRDMPAAQWQYLVRSVIGPLIAGSMRYLGLGLFVPSGSES
ncbi:hypothetical protein [Nonomuraea typhae]|uniref:Uncharacterized protein n=1 Tax=Nonomuraea typhae TaxID=2603600 RepID=A0ABW7ZCK6_9ACTN